MLCCGSVLALHRLLPLRNSAYLGHPSPAGLNSEEELAWLYGAYALVVIVVTPFFGYLGDRIGGRSVMLCGMALLACAAALSGLANSFQILLFARLFQGAGSDALWTAGLATVAAHYVEKRVEMIGYAFTGSTAGSVLGPVIGGWLSHLGGYTLPFLVTGALLVMNACLLLAILPAQRSSPKARASIRPLLRSKSLALSALAVALAAFAVGVIEPLLPVRLARFGMTSTATGLIFTVATLVYGLSAPVVGRISETLSINKVIALGTIAMALTLPLLAAFRQASLVCVAAALVYVSFAFMLNPASAELGNAAARSGISCYSAVYAVYNIVYSIGMLATAALASTAAQLLGFLGALLCVSAVLLLCTPLLASAKPPQVAIPEPSESRAS